MSESRKRLSLGSKKIRKTPKKPVLESTIDQDPMLDALLEESEEKVKELREAKESKRPRLDLSDKKKVEPPKEKLVTDRDMFNVPKSEQDAAAERLKAKAAAKRAAKKDLKEEVIETPQDRFMSALDGQLSAMGRLAANSPDPTPKSLQEQKIENL